MPSRLLRAMRKLVPASGKARVGVAILLGYVLVALFGTPLVALLGLSADAISADSLQPPSAAHLLGTTQDGQDVFAQLVVGTRTSLLVGVVAAGTSMVISVIVGVLGGYYGGTIGAGLNAVTNVFLVIPTLPLIIVLAGYLQGRGGPVATALVIGLTGWAWGARAKRVQTMSLRHREFVIGARLLGESDLRIMTTQILPHLLPLIAASFVLGVSGSILVVSGLDFLGIGNINTVSWGTMLYFAQRQQALFAGAWWWFVPPGLAIVGLGAAAGLINFGIDEVTNPRLRVIRRVRRPRAVAVAA